MGLNLVSKPVTPFGVSLRAAADDVRDVAVRLDDFQCAAAPIPRVGTQVFAAPHAWSIATHHDGLQHGFELRNVLLIGLVEKHGYRLTQ